MSIAHNDAGRTGENVSKILGDARELALRLPDPYIDSLLGRDLEAQVRQDLPSTGMNRPRVAYSSREDLLTAESKTSGQYGRGYLREPPPGGLEAGMRLTEVMPGTLEFAM